MFRSESHHPHFVLPKTGTRKSMPYQPKKLSSEIMLGKATEHTAMELDGEGTTNFEQLKDLIKKECDRTDCCYAALEEKYKKSKRR